MLHFTTIKRGGKQKAKGHKNIEFNFICEMIYGLFITEKPLHTCGKYVEAKLNVIEMIWNRQQQSGMYIRIFRAAKSIFNFYRETAGESAIEQIVENNAWNSLLTNFDFGLPLDSFALRISIIIYLIGSP